jgi:peptidyl-prolyl cis-trans isomerase C
MRRSLPLLAAGGLVIAAALLPAAAQQSGPAAASPPASAADPVVARVDGTPLLLSEVVDGAADLLPPELRALPPATLTQMLPPQLVAQLIDRAITERVLVTAAVRAGLERDAEVERRIRRAREQELQQALLTRELSRIVTPEAVRARYDQETGRRTGEEEVRARHILVPTEAAARQALAEVQRPGADFAEVAKRRSTDSSAAEGGDLGFFKQSAMVPEFAAAAFALQPGQVTSAPVRTTFGWHIIKVEERRAAPVPSFEEARDSLRQRMMEEQVDAVVTRLRQAATVERLDQAPGAGRSLLDNAAPPPPAAPAPAPAPRR